MKFAQNVKEAKFGCRKAVLIDLAPAATHISNRYNTGFRQEALEKEGENLLDRLNKECGWKYKKKKKQKKKTKRIAVENSFSVM